MGTAVSNNTDRSLQEMAKRRLEYENKKSDIKTAYSTLSILGGTASGLTGFIGGLFVSGAIENTLLDDFALTGAGIPLLTGLGIALGGSYLSYRYSNKSIEKEIAKLNKEYNDVLTQEEIKKYNIDTKA